MTTQSTSTKPAIYQPKPPTTNSSTLGLGGKVWITKYQPTKGK